MKTVYHASNLSIHYVYWKYGVGSSHREDGPSNVEFFENGNVHKRFWSINGRRYRENGPAVIIYDINGNIEETYWYLNGRDISENIEEWMEENNISWPFNKEEELLFKMRFL